MILETVAMVALRALLQAHTPDVLIVDPLAELHTAPENDNTALRAVIASLRVLAVEFNFAVVVLHHTKKGPVTPGDPDAARGASSQVGAARIVLTLCGMSEDEAEMLGIAKDRKIRASYIRLDDAKQNYTAIGDARWFEKVVYKLSNDEYVAAAVPWKAPDMWDGISTRVANEILDDIEAGLEGGRRYSAARSADERAAWKVVIKHVGSLSERQARSVIREWVQNAVLRVQDYDDPIDRKSRSGVWVNPANRPGRRN